MKTAVHFSSASCEWETPPALFYSINWVYDFTLDVCASKSNAKCSRYFDSNDNGLSQSWDGICWMNPPYGRTIALWMRKAYLESRKPGVIVVCLVPARTDTAWWHDYVMRGKIHFIRGRIKFGGHKNSAPFPSAIVQFGGVNYLFRRLQHHLTTGMGAK